jgi:hydrogenase maturation protease
VTIAVVGLGNVLEGDDAFGPWVIQWLTAHWEFGEGVSVEDLGTPGLDLHPFLVGHEVIVVVDTVRSEGSPGELRLYRKDQILKHAPQPRLSPHDPGLKESLMALEFRGDPPREVLLVGAIPGTVDHLIGMTGPLRAAVPLAAGEVVKELERLGFPPTRREPPGEPDIWWERR